MERVKIGIIIPVYNRRDITKKGLVTLCNSIHNATESKFEYNIIVIDDGSTDGTSEMIISNFANIHLLHGDGSLWWAGAVNLGAKYAIKKLNSDYILLWNDDIEPSSDYFISINTLLNEDYRGEQIWCSTIKDYNTKKIWFNGAYYSRISGHFRHWITEDVNDKIINCSTGMGTLIPASIVIQNKYWDNKRFPQYFADIDFTLRANMNGTPILVGKNLLIYNKTEYSSYNQNTNYKKYFLSLCKIQSRYNLIIEIRFHLKYCKTPLWIYFYFKKHLKYMYHNILSMIGFLKY